MMATLYELSIMLTSLVVPEKSSSNPIECCNRDIFCECANKRHDPKNATALLLVVLSDLTIIALNIDKNNGALSSHSAITLDQSISVMSSSDTFCND